MNSGSRLHPFLIAAGLYAALLLPLAVLTRMTPVCLPGLIDFNADIEAILFGLVPAIAAGICLPAERSSTRWLLWTWMLATVLFISDGPGVLPDVLTAGFIVVLGLTIIRNRAGAASLLVTIGLSASLWALAATTVVTDIGARLHDAPLRQEGRLAGIGVTIWLGVMLWMAYRAQRRRGDPDRRPWNTLKRLGHPAVSLIAGGALLRLAAPYDPTWLTVAAALWLSGFIILLLPRRAGGIA